MLGKNTDRVYFGEEKSFNMGCIKDFELIFNAYYAPLCVYAQNYIDRKDAEDQISNMFCKLWTNRQVFKDTDHMRAFLYTASKNSCLDFLKTSQRSRARDQAFSDTQDKIEDFFTNDLIRTEVWAEVYREINGLPSQCSEVIKAGYIEGLSNEETATLLGISLQTVKNHKYRGLKILRRKLADLSYTVLLMLVSTM